MQAPVCCLFLVALFVELIGISGRVKYLLILFSSTGGWCEGIVALLMLMAAPHLVPYVLQPSSQ